MKFRIVVEFDPETQSYSAVCPELPGCASAGDTEEDASANIEEATRCISNQRQLFWPVTPSWLR
jgi:predicted RNase H-like HicB family nuclease